MGLTLNFRNILDLYGIQAGNYSQNEFTLAENADLFLSIFDFDVKDDEIDKESEYKLFLKALGLPEHMADNLFDKYADGGDKLNKTQILAMLNDLNSDGNDYLTIDEALKLYNESADIDLDTDTTNFAQYASFFSAAKNFMASMDTDNSQTIDEAEYSEYLIKKGMQGRYGIDFVNLFDTDDVGKEIDFEEIVAKYVAWDKNNDGAIDMTNPDDLLQEGKEYLDLYQNSQKSKASSYMPSSFNNILNIFNVGVNGDYNKDRVTDLNENARSFIDVVDSGNDGTVSEEEFTEFLNDRGLSGTIATNLFNQYESNSDADTNLSVAELEAAFASFDNAKNGNNTLDFEEGLAFFNQISGYNVTIDMSQFEKEKDAFKYYSTHFNTAQALILNFDKDKDGEIEINNADGKNEMGAALEAIRIPESYSADMITLIDGNPGGTISFDEYFKKNLAWDTDHDGVIELYDKDNPEAIEYYNFLPEVYQTPVTNIEKMAQQFILQVDQYQNLEIEEDEYKAFITQAFGFSEEMAAKFIDQYSGGDDTDRSVSFNDLVNAYNSFDTVTVDDEGNESAGPDGSLTYEEMINFQNSLTTIDIDTSLIKEEQYNGLYQTALSVVKSMDEDLNGEVSVDEYRAVLTKMYENSGVEAPDHAAENFIRMFDMDKNGTVNVIEAMNKYAEYDDNKDGFVSGAESTDLLARLQDKTLWDNVNSLIMDEADTDKNAKLTLDEYKNYLKEKGLPEYIADDAFTLFDRKIDGISDGKLSRLELMEAFSRYDGNVENLASYQNLTGETYTLYTGDGDNKLDADEMLKLYEDLANEHGYSYTDGEGVEHKINYNPDKSKLNQYAPITASLEEFIAQTDFDNNGLISVDEYKTYLEGQGLPAYFADNAVDNAIVNFDLNNDDNLDFLEWVQVNLDYDTNSNGQLEMDEVLQMCGDLSGIALAVDKTNVDQYELLYDKANIMIENYDRNGDRILSADELEEYMEQYDLPAVLATDMVTAYNSPTSPDAGLDAIELLKAFSDYDANNNGQLEFEEEFALYDNMSAVDLGLDADNANQYSKINDTVSELVENFDINKNNKLDVDEIKEFFKAEGMTEDAANQALAAYDVNGPDSALDVVEWMKLYSDFDANEDGNLNNQEKLAMFDTLATTGLNPDASNAVQLSNIEQTTDALIQKFDIDGDKKLSVAEFEASMKELGLPDYIAENILNMNDAAFDRNNDLVIDADDAIDLNNDSIIDANDVIDQDHDGNIDKLEWMKALVNFDANNDGILQFNEKLTMNSTLAGARLDPSADEMTQYNNLYNNASYLFNQKDKITDKILMPEEIKGYFTDLQLPEYMAQEAINLYDTNNDGGLDIYEWMKAQKDFDVNKSGVLEFNEQMSMNGIIADPNVALDPETMDVTQVSGLYNYSLNYLNYLDTDNNKQISETEYQNYLRSAGLSENIATDIITDQDLNGDGDLDIMELLSTNMVLDTNKNGTIDFDETMNMYQNATGINFNTTDGNLNQHATFYNYAINTINQVGGSDKKLSSTEFKNWLKDYCAMSEDMADTIVNHYDNKAGVGNGDNELDALEFAKALIDIDTAGNQNNAWDVEEIMNFIDEALPTIDFGGVDDTNKDQYWSFYKYAIDTINQVGGSDKELSGTEFKNWLKDYYAISDDMADKIVNHYDHKEGVGDGNGSLNAMELAKALIDVDTAGNQNNTWDVEEIMNFIDEALPTIDFGGVDDSNKTQFSTFYQYAIDTINQVGGSDKELSGTEFKNWLKDYYAISDDMADKIVNHYDHKEGVGDGNGSLDAMELAKALIDVDTAGNQNNTWDVEEIMNFIDDALPDVNLGGVNDSNKDQYWNLYYKAITEINSYAGSDKKLTSDEYYNLYLKGQGLPEYMAKGLIEELDKDGNNYIDAFELTKKYIELDTNKTGALEFDELMKYYETIAEKGAAIEGVPDSENLFNFNPNITNRTQLANLHYGYTNLVKSADINADSLMQADEYEWTLASAGFADAATMANNAVSIYDLNQDGAIDSLEWMDAVLKFDSNRNGWLDGQEITNFYESIE